MLLPYDREIDTSNDRRQHLRKILVKTVKEPGLKGGLEAPLFILKADLEAASVI